MQLIKADKFFDFLHAFGVRKSNEQYNNLLQSLILHKNVKDVISIEES